MSSRLFPHPVDQGVRTRSPFSRRVRRPVRRVESYTRESPADMFLLNANDSVESLTEDDDDDSHMGFGHQEENANEYGDGAKEPIDEINHSKSHALTAKRQKKSKITDDLVCPITQELPFYPVTANDGRVYEELAIEMHISTTHRNGGVLRSPITNLSMGSQLLPAPQTKNTIQALIDDGVIHGELVAAWNIKVQEQEKKEKLVREAEAGNAKSMFDVAWNYSKGDGGFKKDDTSAFEWYEKSHYAGNVQATAVLGYLYGKGRGAEKNFQIATTYLGIAAAKGSDFAAYNLAMAYTGKSNIGGLSVNQKEAIHWLEVCLDPTCAVKNLTPDFKDRAKETLKKLRDETSEH